MKEFFRGELYRKYRKALSEVIDRKMNMILQSLDDTQTRELRAEIRTLVWVRDDLPKTLMGDDAEVPSPPVQGSEYDAPAEGEGPEETPSGGYGNDKEAGVSAS
jgi:hypothetical protein